MGKNIRYFICRELESRIMLGTNKRSIKKENNGDTPYIHSAATARTYMQQARQYGNWLRERGLNKCSMAKAREHAAAYILSQSSEWSRHTARSALAKVFGCKGDELCELDKRDPRQIIRGRGLTARAAAVERNHPELAEACRSIGLRHGRELMGVTASNFHLGDAAKGQLPDKLYCRVQGKGGRWRDAMVMDGPGRAIIEKALLERPEGPLFEIPSHANVHGWRADYAARCYAYALAQAYGNGELYHCRDGSGKVYDKAALAWVSEQLGHGRDRYYTVVYNYLSYGNQTRG